MSGQENKDDKDNQTFHEYLDMLASQKFNGDITLYFKDGVIESLRKNYILTKNQIKNMPRKVSVKLKKHD